MPFYVASRSVSHNGVRYKQGTVCELPADEKKSDCFTPCDAPAEPVAQAPPKAKKKAPAKKKAAPKAAPETPPDENKSE